MIRLNKFLAERLGVSRREADELILGGKVSVNDQLARVGQQINESDSVSYDGRVVDYSHNYTYLILNKPTGYVCSRRQQDHTPTLYSLLPQKYQSLKTVGRLDKDSSGLILLTDDGDFAFRMTHPKFIKTKTYEVALDMPLAPLHQQMIADFGVQLPDGKSQLGLTRLSDDRKEWLVTMHEGRNRQIRRTFAAVGYTVTKLHRISFGPYHLTGLPLGKYVVLDQP